MKIDPHSWPVLSRLLDEWLDLAEESRGGWLESLRPEHSALVPILRRLISTQDGADARGFLRTLPTIGEPVHAAVFHDTLLSAGLTAGAVIGPYRLLRELGQGGMGVVWLAERADGELKRPVALKLPIVSLPGRMLVERFTRERDILARLTHPHIARLYDAGVTDGGQPYLALEYVEGESITSYCDRLRLSVKPRLELFLDVLRAAQYAHTNLVVHRDLKPANILVTGDGEVRLLDFGIAKLLSDGEANETELTRVGGRALTPDYASPEQIAGDTITTGSDVYSLGVILYEVLTGARPYKLKRPTRSGLEEAILGSDPARPSQSVPDEAAAQARGSTAVRLARKLKGDLDTIVLKALAKQPPNRYATADAFAQDIERYLAGDAVLAQPESNWRRVRRFVLRNKVVVSAAAAVIMALSIGLGVALREAHIAQVQTKTAETVRAFLLDIFRANSSQHADPVKARQTTARELLDIGAKRIDGELRDSSEAKLGVLETLFKLYLDLGLQEQAAALAHERIALARVVYGPHHLEVARALVELAADSASSSFANDRPALLKEAGSILDRNRDWQSPIRAQYYLAMGATAFRTDLDSTVDFGLRSVKLYRTYPPSRELVSALNLVGQAQNHLGRNSEATANLSEAAQIANSLGGEARGPLPSIYAYLGDSQRHAMDLKGAESNLRQAVEVARTLKGDDHPDVLQTEYRLGVFLSQTSRPQEGLDWLKKSVELAIRTQGPEETFHTPMAREGYGLYLIRYGRVEDGLALFAQVIDVLRRAKQAATESFASTLALGASGEIELGHYRQAEAALAEVAAIYSRIGHPEPGYRSDAALASAELLIATGKADEAATALQQVPMDSPGPGKMSYVWLDQSLARAEADLACKRPAGAIERARDVRTRIGESGLADYFKRWEAQAALLEGKGLLLEGHVSEALPMLERAVELGGEVYDRDRSPLLAESQIALAWCLAESGRTDGARALLSQAKAIHATHQELGEQFRAPLRALDARLRIR
jgi:serine/threonine-protein kinase